MKRPSILVFGAAGQLGAALSEAAESRPADLIGLDRCAADVTEADAVAAALDRYRPRVVVNAAAFTAVDKAEIDIVAATEVNATGPGHLARAAARRNIPLIHISTDYVFDGEKREPYDESDQINPLNVYGRTKAEGEARIRELWTDHVIIRTAWLFGRSGSNFVRTILGLAGERPEIRAVTDQRGSPTSADDLAVAIFAAAQMLETGRPICGTYHFAGAGSASRFDYADAILGARAELKGPGPKLLPAVTRDFPTAARRPANSALDPAHFARTFGVQPRPWREGVRSTVLAILGTDRLPLEEAGVA